MSEPSIDEEGSVPPTEAGDKGDNPPPRKRQRVRLSCLECRRRKLSCDREFPCSRCLQSGTPERCEYETRPGLAPPNKLGLAQSPLSSFDTRLSLPNGGGDSSFYRRDSLREHDRIRRLELEVAQLKGLLAKQCSTDGSTLVGTSPSTQQAEEKNETRAQSSPSHLHNPNEVDLAKDELRFFRGKEWKTRYFGHHNARLAFSEVGSCFPPQTFFSPSYIVASPLSRTPCVRGKVLALSSKRTYSSSNQCPVSPTASTIVPVPYFRLRLLTKVLPLAHGPLPIYERDGRRVASTSAYP